ncbi:MAG TPA: thioredoxin-like domain-containing protein [Chthoniobacterales bacterium]|nr:thioredoxin-like domain-containing protein [Chthoniobacterales bacterium]
MLRSGYSSEVVLQELSKRKFADTLDPTSEEQLVKAGASQSLINTLESGVYQLSAAETAAAAEKQKSNAEKVSRTNLEPQAAIQSAPTKPASPTEAQVGGNLYDHFKDDLVYWHEGSLVPFDDETLEKKKFYLLFFSAIWSKEGRQFTSRLVDYYNRVAPQHPEFEIVFFSADRSQFAMENYVSQTNMPWPAVAYEKLQGKAGALASAFTHQIPRLILAEASGRVLSDSGETRPDFDKVMIDLDKVLAGN